MARIQAKPRFLPILGLLAAVLVLLTVVTVTTYFNLDRGGKQARRALSAQATAVVSGLAAGLRTGWRYWAWRADSLQALVQEMSQVGDVAFIAILDHNGRILAHSDSRLVGRIYKELPAEKQALPDVEVRGWFDRQGGLHRRPAPAGY